MVLNTFVLTLNPFHTDSANSDLIQIANPEYRMAGNFGGANSDIIRIANPEYCMAGNFGRKMFWRIAENMSMHLLSGCIWIVAFNQASTSGPTKRHHL